MVKRNEKKWFRHGNWWRRLRNNRKYRDVIFMKMKNDLSFMIGNTLNLYEHQSTWNPNMPLRGLLYFAQQFEGLLNARGDDAYGNGCIGLPTPVYIVFYNGVGMQSDNIMLYLSDSFSAGRGSGCLECTCEVLNINRGYNRPLMEKCHRLWEYSEFTSEIEENVKSGMRREEAVHTAIDTCIEKGILADILIKQKAEVLHMILTEYDEKKHLKTVYREGREDLLREQIQKKLAKGKTISEIAEDLEEEISVIQRMVDNFASHFHR